MTGSSGTTAGSSPRVLHPLHGSSSWSPLLTQRSSGLLPMVSDSSAVIVFTALAKYASPAVSVFKTAPKRHGIHDLVLFAFFRSFSVHSPSHVTHGWDAHSIGVPSKSVIVRVSPQPGTDVVSEVACTVWFLYDWILTLDDEVVPVPFVARSILELTQKHCNR